MTFYLSMSRGLLSRNLYMLDVRLGSKTQDYSFYKHACLPESFATAGTPIQKMSYSTSMWRRDNLEQDRERGVEQRGGVSLRLAKVMEWQRGWREEEEEEAAIPGAQKRIRWASGEKGGVPRSKERPQDGQNGWKDLGGQGTSVFNLCQSERSLSESREEKLQREAATDKTEEAAEKEGSDGKVCAEEVDTGGGGFTQPTAPLSFSGFPSLDVAAAAAATAAAAAAAALSAFFSWAIFFHIRSWIWTNSEVDWIGRDSDAEPKVNYLRLNEVCAEKVFVGPEDYWET